MWNEIFSVALSNGLFAALFVALFIYQLRDSSSREKKYQQTISKLNEHLDIVVDIKEDIEDIKKQIAKEKKDEKFEANNK